MGNSTKKESSQSILSVSIIDSDSCEYVNANKYSDFEDIDIGMKCLHLHYNIDFTEMYKLRSESKDLPGMFPEINYNEEEEESAEDPPTESVMDSFYPDVQMQFVLEL